MKPLRILITNISLSGRSGTETVVRDLAIGLVRRGHLPVVFSPMLAVPGQEGVASEIRDSLVPITDDLCTIAEPPDIIHGNHLHETMTACLRFPSVPAVWLCHSWDGPHDRAPRFPNVMKFLAVDEACLERVLCEESVPRYKTQLLLNCVDLTRFKSREPLPAKPAKALVLSHYAAHSLWFEAVQEACRHAGIHLEAVGAGLGAISKAPEELLQNYDIVFAVDRTAMEATAVGNAVILCGQPGLGPLVTSEICQSLHQQNFGRKWLNEPVTVDGILRRIDQYDPLESKKASEIIRQSANFETYFDQLESIYRSAINDYESVQLDQSDLLCSASEYMTELSGAVRTHIWGNDEYLQTRIQRDGLADTAERRRLRLEKLEGQRHAAVIENEVTRKQLAQIVESLEVQKSLTDDERQEKIMLKATLERVEEELRLIRSSKTFVLKDRVFRMIGLGAKR